MGTITITQYGDTGADDNPDQPLAQLDSVLVRTQDATTSTTAESITLNQNTSFVRIYAAEAHRICLDSNKTGDGGAYQDVQATTTEDYGVKGGATLYYRSNA